VQLGGTGEKIGFAGAAPVVRPVGANQAAVAAATYAAPNAGAVNSGDAGTDTVITSLRTQLIAPAADVADIRTKYNQVRGDLVTLGLIKGAA
jgi:hypothetical protein